MSDFVNFPKQALPFSSKTRNWRKQCVDWADSKTFFNYSPVRKSVIHKKINYDLLNGKLHMEDIQAVINPENIKVGYIPDRIQHYSIMNSKLNILRGEEAKRVMDYRVVVTNPNAVSEIEENKRNALVQAMQQTIADTSLSEDEYNAAMEKLTEYFNYQWQDFREIRANCLLNHYYKEYNMSLLFNQGFMDAMTVGEEIYKCDIVGGEPVIERVNPLKIRVFKSGYSNRVEDADIIIIEDYWSPGRVIDTYYDVLTRKDIEYIEKLPDHIGQAYSDSMDNIDERMGFVNSNMVGDEIVTDGFYFDPLNLFSDSVVNSLLPYDLAGNLRVLQIYWKSKRKIKKVKSYDPETGEEIFTFYPETYITDKARGEEEEIFYINEAWEGTKIGDSIYVNMRPRIVQYNRLSNPSRCHFGIIGSIYNLNESRPFSLVDMMKQYNYLYDIIYDRLNKLMARNWGKIIQLDFAKIPKGWEISKWMYYAAHMGLAVYDSNKEGNYGAATGKIAGTLNTQTGVIDADWGNNIQQYINLLQYIKMEMGEIIGISPQREGQISNRETVGGIERATLQSAHITEWLFLIHEDVKKRVLECFLETAKAALKGHSKKFSYILPDNTMKIVDIDGDEFSEADYGLVVDNSNGLQKLQSQLETLAQAALQNSTLSFSTIMKIYSSASLAEKQRMIEEDERKIRERAEQAQQQQLQVEQQKIQADMEAKEREYQHEDMMNQRDNETRLLIANINAQSTDDDGIPEPMTEAERAKLREQIREFNRKIELENSKLEFQKNKQKEDAALKRQQINKQTNTGKK